MKVRLKIIEFSSDIFSKSSQLKDIQISPLFSNNNFNINIFDAIAKNEEYEIKTNTTIIKIGLYQGKSILGIGTIDINKQSQKIKITSEQKNQSNLFLNNVKNNKTQDNDYYLILECINNNKDKDKDNNDKFKNSFLKDNKHKKKKNASVDTKLNNTVNNNYKSKENKNKLNNSLKEYNHNLNVDRGDDGNKIDSNFYDRKNRTNLKIEDNKDHDNDNDKESNEFIFNESFQKENFSDGVLILDKDNTDKNKDKIKEKNINKVKNINENMDKNIFLNKNMENVEIKDFENLINDFYLIYNNVNNNNSLGLDNIKDNFILEYQYFLEKTSDIFNLYSNLSNKLNNQNIYIKKYIINLNTKIKSLYKKQILLKIKSQNKDINQLKKDFYIEEKKYYNYGIKAINNKLSLVKDINKDISLLTNNTKQKKRMTIKKIFESVLNNERINKYLKNDENFIKFLIKNREKIRINLENKNNKNNIYDNDENNDKKNNKVDIEVLKSKIDKLKNQYLNETVPKEQKNIENFNEINKNKKINENKYQNKINSLSSNNRSAKNIHKKTKNKYSNNPSITEIYEDYKNNKHLNNHNVFTPNSKRRNKKMIKNNL